MIERKYNNFWKDFKNIEALLRPVCEELGRMPSANELINRGLGNLSRYIYKYHGGSIEVAKKLGYLIYDEVNGRHSHDYWNYENTLKELITYIQDKKINYIPTKNDFLLDGRQDLYSAITKNGRQKMFSDPLIQVLGLVKKPRELKWTEETILQKLEQVIETLGYFPSGTDLDSMGLAGLRGAIERFGGKQKFWKLLGMPSHQDRQLGDTDLIESAESVKQAIEELANNLGHFTTCKEIQQLKLNILNIGIKKFFGNISKLAEEIGIDKRQFLLLKARDGHILRSVSEIIVDNILSYHSVEHLSEGQIDEKSERNFKYDFKVADLDGNPVFIEIWGYRSKDENKAISKIVKAYLERKEEKINFYIEKGIKYISLEGHWFDKSINLIYQKVTTELLKANIISNPPKQLSQEAIEFLIYNVYDTEAILQDITEIAMSLGHMPTARDLMKINRGDLIDNILKLGGFPHLRKILKLDKKQIEKKWSKEKLREELEPFVQQLGRLPTAKELEKVNRLDIVGGIYKNGGHRKVAEDLGWEYITNYVDYRDWDFFKSELLPLCEQEGYLFSADKLKQMGKGKLGASLKFHGGEVEVAIKLGYELFQPKWDNQKYAYWVFERIIKSLGKVPSPVELKKQGYDGLLQCLRKYYGGIDKVASELGYQYQPVRQDYSDFKSIQELLVSIAKEIGHFPARKDLKERGLCNLYVTISKRYGGLRKVCEDLGYVYPGR
ncbi:MAG TPA: hypothetical protein V6D25_24635 [Leptolyngbyaceae cyanobacterium]